MKDLHQRLRSRGEEIAAKVIDGEAIIIDLANGIYYSMDKVGGLIWDMVQSEHSLEEMIVAVTDRYQVSREQVDADVQALIEELLRENLVAVSENGGPAAEMRQVAPGEKLPYEAPKLNIYRDMGDLLALDPPTPGLSDTPWKNPGDKSSN
jgi:hypothetical protein